MSDVPYTVYAVCPNCGRIAEDEVAEQDDGQEMCSRCWWLIDWYEMEWHDD